MRYLIYRVPNFNVFLVVKTKYKEAFINTVKQKRIFPKDEINCQRGFSNWLSQKSIG